MLAHLNQKWSGDTIGGVLTVGGFACVAKGQLTGLRDLPFDSCLL